MFYKIFNDNSQKLCEDAIFGQYHKIFLEEDSKLHDHKPPSPTARTAPKPPPRNQSKTLTSPGIWDSISDQSHVSQMSHYDYAKKRQR